MHPFISNLYLLKKDMLKNQTQSTVSDINTMTTTSLPPTSVSPKPPRSSPSSSSNHQSSLRVFRNVSSKQQPTEQLLRNNNGIQRSTKSDTPSPTSEETPSLERGADSDINKPLDFTSKKV